MVAWSLVTRSWPSAKNKDGGAHENPYVPMASAMFKSGWDLDATAILVKSAQSSLSWIVFCPMMAPGRFGFSGENCVRVNFHKMVHHLGESLL